MKLRKRVRLVPEALLMLIGGAFLPLLSRAAVVRLSRFLGLCSYAASGRLRRIADANLDLAFGDTLSPREKRAISKASFQSFSLVVLDLFWFSRDTKARLEAHLTFDPSFDHVFKGAAAINVTAHLGNWEVMNLGCGVRGYPLTTVVMPLRNALADRMLNRIRKETGVEISQRSGAIRRIIRALREGRGVALVVDQNTLPQEGGVFVPFFGLPVPVSRVTGSLWAKTKARIIVVWCIPDGQGHYTAYARPQDFATDETLTSEQVVANVTLALEAVIRKYPQFWLWSYKRWRFYRDEDPAEKYPFYAKGLERYWRIRALEQKHRDAILAEQEARQAVRDAESEPQPARRK